VECQSRRFLITCFCFSPLLALTACSSPEPPPPPAVILRPGVTLRADPNPIIPEAGGKTGKTTVYWKAPVKEVQLRLGAPNGTLWGNGPGTSHSETGAWVSNGMTFYLQDNTAPNPTDPSATLAKLTVFVKLP
jgi:hypothetical protein